MALTDDWLAVRSSRPICFFSQIAWRSDVSDEPTLSNQLLWVPWDIMKVTVSARPICII
ncbi:hypothetical protein LINGRAHAP2_LOCUS2216 [Linum grandiflorum]